MMNNLQQHRELARITLLLDEWRTGTYVDPRDYADPDLILDDGLQLNETHLQESREMLAAQCRDNPQGITQRSPEMRRWWSEYVVA